MFAGTFKVASSPANVTPAGRIDANSVSGGADPSRSRSTWAETADVPPPDLRQDRHQFVTATIRKRIEQRRLHDGKARDRGGHRQRERTGAGKGIQRFAMELSQGAWQQGGKFHGGILRPDRAEGLAL